MVDTVQVNSAHNEKVVVHSDGSRTTYNKHDNSFKHYQSKESIDDDNHAFGMVISLLLIVIVLSKVVPFFIERDILEYIVISAFWISLAIILPPKAAVIGFFKWVSIGSLIIGMLALLNCLLMLIAYFSGINFFLSLDSSNGETLLYSVGIFFIGMLLYAGSSYLSLTFDE